MVFGVNNGPTHDYDATCATEGCANAGYPIRLSASGESPMICCGVCSENITEISLADASA